MQSKLRQHFYQVNFKITCQVKGHEKLYINVRLIHILIFQTLPLIS